MTSREPQPEHKPGDELPVHTVGIFITYRKDAPIESKRWAELIAGAIRHAPFIIEAVTAAGLENVRNERTAQHASSNTAFPRREEPTQSSKTDGSVAGTS